MWELPEVPEEMDAETRKELKTQGAAFQNVVVMAEKIKGLVGNAPEVIGFLGGAQRKFASLASQIEGAYRLISGSRGTLKGQDVPDSELRNPGNYTLSSEISEKIRSYTTDPQRAAIIKSNLISLAYAVAKAEFGQEGRGLSDRDVERTVESIGGAVGDPDQMKSVLNDLVERSKQSYVGYYNAVTSPVLTPEDIESAATVEPVTPQNEIPITQPSKVLRFDERGNLIQ
jgi:hypothetical protein